MGIYSDGISVMGAIGAGHRRIPRGVSLTPSPEVHGPHAWHVYFTGPSERLNPIGKVYRSWPFDGPKRWEWEHFETGKRGGYYRSRYLAIRGLIEGRGF